MGALQPSHVLLLLTAAAIDVMGQSTGNGTITQDPSPFYIGYSNGSVTLTCHISIATSSTNYQWSSNELRLSCQENEATVNTCTFRPQVADVNRTVECSAAEPNVFSQIVTTQLSISTGPPPATTTTHSTIIITTRTPITTITPSTAPPPTTTPPTTQPPPTTPTTTTPTTSITEGTTTTSTPAADDTPAINVGAVVGGTVAGAAVVVIVGLVIYIARIKNKWKHSDRCSSLEKGASYADRTTPKRLISTASSHSDNKLTSPQACDGVPTYYNTKDKAQSATYGNDGFDPEPSSGVYNSFDSDYLELRHSYTKLGDRNTGNSYAEIRDSNPEYLTPCYVPGANPKLGGERK